MVSAFSIGKSQRTTYGNNNVPGPGAYNPIKRQKYTPPTYKIGTSNRSGLLKVFAPGPGAYDPPGKVTREGPRYTFGLKKQAETLQMFNPGPGAYNPNHRPVVKALPMYSMGSKFYKSDTQFTPGPGNYESKSTVVGVPSMKFPHSQRLGLYDPNRNPGPGSYGLKRPASAGPQYRFGSSERTDLAQSSVPGPGEYEQLSEFKQSRKGFSMVARRSATHGDRVPGPGSYNWDKKQKYTPPAYKIGNESRISVSKEQLRNPGPGQYESRYEFARPRSAQVRIGSSTRRPLNDATDAPGPGTYDLQSRVGEGPKYQILGNKYEPNTVNRQPGPGAYNPNDSQVKGRPASAKIGTGHRGDMGASNQAPGVGNYNLRQGPEGPKWGFGSSNRPPLNPTLDVPGPGGYDIKPTFADVPKYLIPPKY